MSTPRDFQRGLRLYETFYAFEAREVGAFHGALEVPDDLSFVGVASFMSYRSDKWEKQKHNYWHDHAANVRVYVPTARGPRHPVPGWLQRVSTLVKLGDCLGFGYVDIDKNHVEAKVGRPYPELYTIPTGKALLVIQGKRKLEAVLWGGKLRVTSHGIEG